MNDVDIPILKKAYDLYLAFHECRKLVPKADRFTVYERGENAALDIIECLLEAGYGKAQDKARLLDRASVKLNLFRFLIRMLKDTRSVDTKKYVMLQAHADEVGRMLGGWIRSQGSR